MFLEAHNYDSDNIYNADETGLYYKELPNKTLALHDERQAFGRKQAKQRVTVLVFENATGTQKIPLLVLELQKFHIVLKPIVKIYLRIMMLKKKLDGFFDFS